MEVKKDENYGASVRENYEVVGYWRNMVVVADDAGSLYVKEVPDQYWDLGDLFDDSEHELMPAENLPDPLEEDFRREFTED